jgi:hypothetical protein
VRGDWRGDVEVVGRLAAERRRVYDAVGEFAGESMIARFAWLAPERRASECAGGSFNLGFRGYNEAKLDVDDGWTIVSWKAMSLGTVRCSCHEPHVRSFSSAFGLTNSTNGGTRIGRNSRLGQG